MRLQPTALNTWASKLRRRPTNKPPPEMTPETTARLSLSGVISFIDDSQHKQFTIDIITII